VSVRPSELRRLLERDDELQTLGSAFSSAVAGQGVGIAVAGESGVGKTSLVARALEVAPPGVRTMRVHCDPLGTPRPLGPIRDLGLTALEPRYETARASELGDCLYQELRTTPTMMLVEDLHWIDEVSADVLRVLARRVEAAPLALMLTYRDLEIGPRHPIRPLLGDIASLEGWRTLALRPLSLAAVTDLAAGTGLDPVRLHELTGGNAFFVTSVLREPDRPIPASVRDAVLAQVYEVEHGDLEVLQLIAICPDGLDHRILPTLGIDLPTLRRLDELALLTRTEHRLAFRHELARLAVASSVPPGGAAVLHARLLDALETLEWTDPAVLTHHAVGAQDAQRVLQHARAGVTEAIATRSNTEAAGYLELALTHLPRTAPVAERAQLLGQLGTFQYLTGRLNEAMTTIRASMRAWEQAGSPIGVAEGYAALAACEYQIGRGAASREHVARACEIAETTGDPATIALTHGWMAMLANAASDPPRAAASARRAAGAGAEAGIAEFEAMGRVMLLGSDALLAVPGARSQLLDYANEVREQGNDEVAWYGYSLVLAADFQQGNLRDAQRVVDDVVAFAIDRDLAVAQDWNISFRGMLHFWAGRWRAAVEDCEASLDGTQLASVWPPLILGLVELRCGEGDGHAQLDAAWSLARSIDEPLRTLAACTGLAERQWMTGDVDERVTKETADILRELGVVTPCRWAAGELAVWLRRLGLAFDDSVITAEPYHSHLQGRTEQAARFWQQAGNPFNEAMALADSHDAADHVRAVTLLDRLGALGTADRLRVELRRRGMDDVPQRPRESTRANPGGLTNRQVDVARLVAEGLTNQEIANRLYISSKTADHHVSAILAKLALPNRRAVALRAEELGFG